MENRPIYQKVKQYILTHTLTVEQVQNATKDQIQAALDPTPEEIVELIKWWPRIKTKIINYLRDVEYNQTITTIKSKLTQDEIDFLKENFTLKA